MVAQTEGRRVRRLTAPRPAHTVMRAARPHSRTTIPTEETMKTVLLPFYDDAVARSAFEAAARLVRRTNGYIEGLFVMRRPQILEGGDGDILADTHFAELQEECGRGGDRGRPHFEACAAEEGFQLSDRGGSDGA